MSDSWFRKILSLGTCYFRSNPYASPGFSASNLRDSPTCTTRTHTQKFSTPTYLFKLVFPRLLSTWLIQNSRNFTLKHWGQMNSQTLLSPFFSALHWAPNGSTVSPCVCTHRLPISTELPTCMHIQTAAAMLFFTHINVGLPCCFFSFEGSTVDCNAGIRLTGHCTSYSSGFWLCIAHGENSIAGHAQITMLGCKGCME